MAFSPWVEDGEVTVFGGIQAGRSEKSNAAFQKSCCQDYGCKFTITGVIQKHLASMNEESPPPSPRISEAEWSVMKVLWELGDASLGDVVKGLGDQCDWKPRTVQTLVRRLVEKGAVAVEVQGRDFRYRPAVIQGDCQIDEGKSFLRKVFDGRLTPFVAALMAEKEVSREELTQLRQLLDAAEAKTTPSNKH